MFAEQVGLLMQKATEVALLDILFCWILGSEYRIYKRIVLLLRKRTYGNDIKGFLGQHILT